MVIEKQRDILVFLKGLGFTDEQRRIYLALVTRGSLSILELSQLVKIPRTSLYRRLEEMKSTGLVEEVVDEYREKIKAVEFEKLEHLVKERELNLIHVKTLLPRVKESLTEIENENRGATKVLYYRGKEAIARMSWQALDTKDELRVYSSSVYVGLVGIKQMLVFKDEWIMKGLAGRELCNESLKKEFEEKPEAKTGKWPNFETRVVPTSMLQIDNQMDIYNDVVAIYNWHNGEIFGIQIFNEKIANFQKQLFDLVWEKVGTNRLI